MLKNLRKKWLPLIITFSAFCFGGCAANNGAAEENQQVYVADFANIELELQYTECVLPGEECFFLIGPEFDISTGNLNTVVVRVDSVNKESKRQVLDTLGMQPLKNGIAAFGNGMLVIAELYEDGVYKLLQYNENMELIGSTDITTFADYIIKDNGVFVISSFVADEEGNLYICCNDSKIEVLNINGMLLYEINSPKKIDSLEITGNGAVVLRCYSEENLSEAFLIDKENQALGARLSGFISRSGGGNVYTGNGDCIYTTTDDVLYSYDVVTGMASVVFEWMECNINVNEVSGVASLENGAYSVISLKVSHSDSEFHENVELATLSLVPENEVPKKKELTLVMFDGSQYKIKAAVIDFNRYNEEYFISVKTYLNEDKSNMEDAIKLFNADLVSGEAMDIIVFPSDYSVDIINLASKGALLDLSELLGQDEEVNKESFIPSIINALLIDDGLYTLGTAFCVHSIVGSKADIEGVADTSSGMGWNIMQVKALMDRYPDALLVKNMDKAGALELLLKYSLDAFYNTELGECYFDSSEFKALLELANMFPYEAETITNEELPAMLRNKELLLNRVYIGNLEASYLYEALYGEEVEFVGYPVNDGSGNVAYMANLMAISANTSDKYGAWEFMRQFFTYDYQTSIMANFPVNEAAFEHMLQLAVSGETILAGYIYGDVEISADAFSDEDAKQLRDIVDSVTRTSFYNIDIYNIVLEEAMAYFSGHKPVEEVMEIIQSRVEMYVGELQ